MVPKPGSTGGKAPAAGAAKTPAKTTEAVKAAKKTAKTTAPTAPAEEKKAKRRRVRKETWSSYTYKGMCCPQIVSKLARLTMLSSFEANSS